MNLLWAAMVLYAGLSRPAPPTPGITEIMIGLCLGVFVLRQFWLAPVPRDDRAGIIAAGVIWACLCLGWIQTIALGPPPTAWIRDFVPVLGWMLPCLLFAAPPPPETARPIDAHGWVPGLCGLLMAGRFWAQMVQQEIPLSIGGYNGWPDYLANDPLLWTGGLWWVMRGLRRGTALFVMLGCLGLAAICLGPILMTLQRAVFGLVLISAIGLFCHRDSPGPVMRMVMLAAGLVGLWLLAPFMTDIWAGVMRKMALGWNSRDQEWGLLWDLVQQEPTTLWLGHGWGSTLASPAVAEWRVTYVHSLAGYLFFKLGLVGLVLWGAITTTATIFLSTLWRRGHRGLCLVLLPGLLVPCLLSTAYKFPGWVMIWLWMVAYSKSSSAASNVRIATASSRTCSSL